MKFVVSSTALLSHLQAISRVINSKNHLPIMDCFLLTVEGNSLTMKATDPDTTLTTIIELIESEGNISFATNARTLLDALRELPDQPLTVDINEESYEIAISYQNGKYNFVGQSGDDFPQKQPMGAGAIHMQMSVETLLEGIARTLFASSDDELRPVMNGVFIDAYEDHVIFVATDTHKLVRFKNFNVTNSGAANFILPKKPANMMKNILAKETGDVEILFDNKNAHFVFSNYKIECRLIEGRYPNYNSVIPQNSPYKMVVDRLTLIAALRRVSVFANQTSNLARLAINPTHVDISAQDIDFSTSAQEALPCQYDGTPLRIGFKAPFLIEILNNIHTQEVSIELTDSSRPGIICPVEDNDEEDILMLIMPMILND